MAKTPNSPKPQHLPQFVGYQQVQDAIGVSRRTIERMVREGRFPRPAQLAPNRVGWQVEAVTNWMSERGKGLVAHAVAHPEDLSPEQLESEAVALVVKAMEKRVGEPVDAADLGIHVTRRLSENQFLAAEKREFAIYSDRFSDFDVQRACVMAAWLFEGLRHIIEQSVPASNRPMYRDAETLELFGGAALHDDTWEETMAAYRKLPGHLDS